MSQYINYDTLNTKISIGETFSTSTGPIFNTIGSSYSVYFSNINSVETLKSFEYEVSNYSDQRYLDTYYRISRDNKKWTEYLTLYDVINNFPLWSSDYTLFINIIFVRNGESLLGGLQLLWWKLLGNLYVDIIETTSATFNLIPGETKLYKPPFIYKIFKLTDLEILYKGDLTSVTMSYRYSQDYGRTTTDWNLLTKDNLISERINPVRFFQIEYMIVSTVKIKIYDINLIGDFQNVTLDYTKTNVFGLRTDLNSIMLGYTNDPQGASDLGISITKPYLTAINDSNSLYKLTNNDKSNLFKPYDTNVALDLYNKLVNDANSIFGHDVLYFLTDPNTSGIDYSFHEYSLYNYVSDKIIKVSVDRNNFPDNQLVINQFNLSLFDTLEVHITKDDFKLAFGVDKRPSKEDFLWFGEVNRMFQVEHAQQFRGFNNSSVYYRVILKNYNQKANVTGLNKDITNKLNDLIKNSTIDSLFKLENELDKKSTSNLEQTKTLTRDFLRLDVYANINRELLENSTTIVSKNNYDLSSVGYGGDAIIYRNFKNIFKKGDNISYTCWFNINNFIQNDNYNFFNYYDSNTNNGFVFNMTGSTFSVIINNKNYDWNIGDNLSEEVWYSYVINIDQRQRNCDNEDDAGMLNSTILEKLYENNIDIKPVMIEIDSNISAKITASDMKITNIRMFVDIIPPCDHNKILNQFIIGTDTKFLIFADNANKKLTLPYLPLDILDDVQSEIRVGTNKSKLSPPKNN